MLISVVTRKNVRKYRVGKIIGGGTTHAITFNTGKGVDSERRHWRQRWLRGLFIVWWRLFGVSMHECRELRTVFQNRWIELRFWKPWEGQIWNKSGFIYLQGNIKASIQYPCFDTADIPKHKWESWFQMYKSVKNGGFKNPEINKTKNSYKYPARRMTDFSDPRKFPPVPILTHGLYPAATSMEKIKLWN